MPANVQRECVIALRLGASGGSHYTCAAAFLYLALFGTKLKYTIHYVGTLSRLDYLSKVGGHVTVSHIQSTLAATHTISFRLL